MHDLPRRRCAVVYVPHRHAPAYHRARTSRSYEPPQAACAIRGGGLAHNRLLVTMRCLSLLSVLALAVGANARALVSEPVDDAPLRRLSLSKMQTARQVDSLLDPTSPWPTRARPAPPRRVCTAIHVYALRHTPLPTKGDRGRVREPLTWPRGFINGGGILPRGCSYGPWSDAKRSSMSVVYPRRVFGVARGALCVKGSVPAIRVGEETPPLHLSGRVGRALSPSGAWPLLCFFGERERARCARSLPCFPQVSSCYPLCYWLPSFCPVSSNCSF